MNLPSQHTKWFKDDRLVKALDDMRQRNMEFMSKCYYCGAEAVAIKSIGERLYPACDIHPGVDEVIQSESFFKD